MNRPDLTTEFRYVSPITLQLAENRQLYLSLEQLIFHQPQRALTSMDIEV